jgi:hypothetical protein
MPIGSFDGKTAEKWENGTMDRKFVKSVLFVFFRDSRHDSNDSKITLKN